TGHEAESVCGAAGDALDDPRVTVVHNPRAGDGMSSSLRAGLAAAAPADAVMIFLADMPRVDAPLARAVVHRYASSAARVAAPLADGRTGHPVILRSDLFPAIERLDVDAGARRVIDENRGRTALLQDVDPATQQDVDVPADLQ
ncbi:MAG: NTP transferase domain-containing protein, partial [Deltaproteobacteria bacterium]|nr:NTP transferase domain-containing protein [Deltaproteobacteria bacterium]